MKIFITGGTGFVGTNLTRQLLDRGHQVTVVSTSGGTRISQSSALQVLKADTTKEGLWMESLGDHDVIVNLAGRSIFRYWTESAKESIRDSRILTTRNMVRGLPQGTDIVLLSTSAVGYYGDGGENELNEQAESGSGFLAEVARQWESEACKAQDKGARVAIMRFGIVLGKNGGALSNMETPFKLGLGGPIGSGRQWFPWIHIDDLVAATIFLMDGGDLHGTFNFTAPQQVRQKEFASVMGSVLNRPALLPVPAFVIRTLAGEFGETLLQSQKVKSKALQERGFVFRYPGLKEALQDIIK